MITGWKTPCNYWGFWFIKYQFHLIPSHLTDVISSFHITEGYILKEGYQAKGGGKMAAIRYPNYFIMFVFYYYELITRCILASLF